MELREFNANKKVYASHEQWSALDQLVTIIEQIDKNYSIESVVIDTVDISDHVLHHQFLPIVVGYAEDYDLYEQIKDLYNYTFEFLDKSRLDFNAITFWKHTEQ